MCRGQLWAEGVARRLPTKRTTTWPSYGGRVRSIALGKVADLCRDERVREQLARVCAAAAADRSVRQPPVVGAPSFFLRPVKR